MWKKTVREVQLLTQGHTASKEQNWYSSENIWLSVSMTLRAVWYSVFWSETSRGFHGTDLGWVIPGIQITKEEKKRGRKQNHLAALF